MKFVTPYEKERIEYLVNYFIIEQRKKTGIIISEDFLVERLFLFDFTVLKETGQLTLNLEWEVLGKYKKLIVPETVSKFYKKAISNINAIDVNFDYFSEYELRLMESIIVRYYDSYDSNTIYEMDVFNKAILNKTNRIEYEYAFCNNINELLDKPIDLLSRAEERFLFMYRISEDVEKM